MPEERFYSEEEANAILRAANEEAIHQGAMSRDELLRAALEAGIPTDAIERAEQKLANERQVSVTREAYQQYLHRKFMNGVGSWLGTSVLLFGINLFTGLGKPWCIWPIGIWGLIVVMELIEYTFSKPWQDDEKLEEWARKRRAPSPEALPDASEFDHFMGTLPLNPAVQKIEAIKAIRKEYGVDLKTAKDAVDSYIARKGL